MDYPPEVVAQAYRNLFESMAGDIVLQDLKSICHHEQVTFVRGDPHMSAFYEGQRSVLLYILDRMREDIENDIPITNTMTEE